MHSANDIVVRPGEPVAVVRDDAARSPRRNVSVRAVRRWYVHEIRPTRYVDVNVRRAMRIADAYGAAVHAPTRPEVAHAYAHFISETLDQFFAARHRGYQFEPWTRSGQPYAHSAQMREDVALRRHLFIFTGGELPADHPLAARSGVHVGGTTLSFNDVFRAVHDLFGHADGGYDFGTRGEENAWRSHRHMYSPTARAAMTTETRGQNAWVNFGPHQRDATGRRVLQPGEPGYLAPPQRPYAPQKATLLPTWCLAP